MPDLVITGPCRSGTALLHTLVNDYVPNAICTNEVVNKGIAGLKAYFAATRKAVNAGKPIANRYARDGSLSDNSWRKGAEIQRRVVEKPLEGDWLMATKVMLGCMDHIPEIVDLGFPVAVIVRDPVYTLGSWGDPKTRGQTVGRITENDMHKWWEKHPFPFNRIDAIGRRAEYWNYLASTIYESICIAPKGTVRLFRYEDLVTDTIGELQKITKWFDMDDPIGAPKLKSANRDDRYPVRMGEIKKVVGRLCPIRDKFGYK